ncbi:hypothetical protein T281_16325 [Rhodomicrobium udaipurense JA643]|nr:hypothetical protein [Rhodomicrobium udaipurense]KAI93503.1 hypothetical protein T281_16325 [Rhodomicrobium udaipurense JA643]
MQRIFRERSGVRSICTEYECHVALHIGHEPAWCLACVIGEGHWRAQAIREVAAPIAAVDNRERRHGQARLTRRVHGIAVVDVEHEPAL